MPRASMTSLREMELLSPRSENVAVFDFWKNLGTARSIFGISSSSGLDYEQNSPEVICNSDFEKCKEPRRSVRFSDVEIREYKVTLGDHPSAKLYPISLDWSHTETRTISVDEHVQNNCIKVLQRISDHPNKIGRRGFHLKPLQRFKRIADIAHIPIEGLLKMEMARQEIKNTKLII